MASDRWDRLKAIVDAFHEEAPEDLEAWLRAHCEVEALRREAASLLRADREGRLSDEDRAADRLPVEGLRPADRSADALQRPSLPETGGTVGPYRLFEEIGLGGMSVVYRAERADAGFEQTVAVKLLRRRLDSERARRRFRTEQQVLASLDHPGIAQLIDGGVTDGDRPYLVMEYVEGVPITEYAEKHGLDLDARLDLLGQTAEALQAAHRQLVVHRDLKPSNIFVTDTETGPLVQLLDFGIAKLLGDTLPVTRPDTETGNRPMTPSYAAPEQVRGGEVSTQTDVYQLGVLAYELLAGRRPFDLEDRSLAETERIITEEAPPRPSTRTAADGVPASHLEGDLDVILLKALRKEPARRYGSVEAMAADLQRFRAGEPVEAQPATLGYRAKKFLRRNAGAVAGIVAFVLAIGGLGAYHIHRISEARDQAQREAQKAEAVAGYLTDLLQSTRPLESGGDTVTTTDMLRRGRRRIDQLDGQPAVKARMLQLLGNTYRARANYEQAAPLLRRSLSIRDSLYDASHRSIANTREELAHLHQELGHYRRADSLWRKALVAQRRRFGRNSSKLWEPLNNLGLLAQKRTDYPTAVSFYQNALQSARSATRPDSGHLSTTLQNLAVVRTKQEQYRQADSLYRKAQSIYQELYQSPHPYIALLLNNRAILHMKQGRLDQADSLAQRATALCRRTKGPQHPYVGIALLAWGQIEHEQNRPSDALSLYRKARAIFQAQLPEDHLRRAQVNRELGRVLLELDRYAEAEQRLTRSLEIFRGRERTSQIKAIRALLTELDEEWTPPEATSDD